MTLIKLYVVNALRSLAQEVQKRTSDTKVSAPWTCKDRELAKEKRTAVSNLRNSRCRSFVHQIYLIRLPFTTTSCGARAAGVRKPYGIRFPTRRLPRHMGLGQEGLDRASCGAGSEAHGSRCSTDC